jgi:hypothetical protein
MRLEPSSTVISIAASVLTQTQLRPYLLCLNDQWFGISGFREIADTLDKSIRSDTGWDSPDSASALSETLTADMISGVHIWNTAEFISSAVSEHHWCQVSSASDTADDTVHQQRHRTAALSSFWKSQQQKEESEYLVSLYLSNSLHWDRSSLFYVSRFVLYTVCIYCIADA